MEGSLLAKIARVRSDMLDIAYEDSGPSAARPVILLHGFPYDPRAFDEVVTILNAAGLRTVVPYLRGYGPTRFLSSATPRSGEQAAVGQDLLDLLDALKIPNAVLAGFDWGGRAACVVSALWPERVTGLVACAGYLIQDIATSTKPADPLQEMRFWYQYYFHTERGRNGLTRNRVELCRLLWKLWSPTWFEEQAFQQTAKSFENEDFADVVIHAYRHRMGNDAGDPHYASVETQLARQPKISVPTVVVHGAVDGVIPVQSSEDHHRYFTGNYQRRVLQNVGHNPPQESPRDFAEAVLALCKRS